MTYAASADRDDFSASADFLRKTRRKISLTRGPAKKICQASAIGKFIAAVCSQVLIKPAALKSLKSKDAAKLIAGHIRQTVSELRIRIIQSTGISLVTRRRVRNIIRRSKTNISRTMASGPHDPQLFSKSYGKYTIVQPANIQCDIITDHRVDHCKGHQYSKYNIFQLIFRHKKTPFVVTVLFVITAGSVRFQ